MVKDYAFVNSTKISGEFNNVNDLCNYVKSLKENIMDNSIEYTVIVVDHTNESGVIYSSDMYISESYIAVANMIASLDYALNTAVEVYSVLGNEYAHIKYKTYNGTCYSSFAACDVSEYDLFTLSRTLYDKNTTIHY